MKQFFGLLLCFLGVQHLEAVASPDNSLAWYLQQAAEQNPGLKSTWHQWQAAVAGAEGADALPDPEFSYDYFIEEVETRVGPQEQKFGARQAFPWFGTLGLRERTADAGAEVAQARLEARKLGVFFEVKEAFYESWYLKQALQIARENIELVEHLEQVAQARVRGGDAASGAIMAQVELGKLADRVNTLEAMRGPLAARLNSSIGRPAGSAVSWPVDPVFHEPVSLRREELTAALRENPMLAMIEANLRKHEFQEALARKERFPNIMVGVDYISTGDALNPGTMDSGKDSLIAKVGLSLPIWSGKNRARIEEAGARREAAVYELSDKTYALEAQLSQAAFTYDDAARKLALYQDTLIPQARQSQETVEDAYAAGKADFLNLIDAERLLLEFQLELERARANLEIGKARIEMLTGQEWAEEIAR